MMRATSQGVGTMNTKLASASMNVVYDKKANLEKYFALIDEASSKFCADRRSLVKWRAFAGSAGAKPAGVPAQYDSTRHGALQVSVRKR